MNYQTHYYNDQRVIQDCSTFSGKEVNELSCIFRLNLTIPSSFSEQWNLIKDAWKEWRGEQPEFTPVFIRVFLSDIANQESLIDISELGTCAYSIIQQPPLGSNAKIAIWCYAQTNVKCTISGNLHQVSHGHYQHYWSGNGQVTNGDSKMQTHELLNAYQLQLKQKGMNFNDNCVRTWFFVQNVDVNYNGVVVGRRENFNSIGLTPDTHYITSTGIEGRAANPQTLVSMDTYAINGLSSGQQQYLYAKSHMNPTYEYGVTFERGTKVSYGDRSHIFISGTASINNKGEVVHIGDIQKQVQRMLENVNTLLLEAEASFDDMQIMIIYLRDIADYTAVKEAFETANKKKIPQIFVLAPVCRPTWLVEMECIAISKHGNSQYECL